MNHLTIYLLKSTIETIKIRKVSVYEASRMQPDIRNDCVLSEAHLNAPGVSP